MSRNSSWCKVFSWCLQERLAEQWNWPAITSSSRRTLIGACTNTGLTLPPPKTWLLSERGFLKTTRRFLEVTFLMELSFIRATDSIPRCVIQDVAYIHKSYVPCSVQPIYTTVHFVFSTLRRLLNCRFVANPNLYNADAYQVVFGSRHYKVLLHDANGARCHQAVFGSTLVFLTCVSN